MKQLRESESEQVSGMSHGKGTENGWDAIPSRTDTRTSHLSLPFSLASNADREPAPQHGVTFAPVQWERQPWWQRQHERQLEWGWEWEWGCRKDGEKSDGEPGTGPGNGTGNGPVRRADGGVGAAVAQSQLERPLTR